jgi:hypothetical protein
MRLAMFRSHTSGGRSVGIVRSQTKAKEIFKRRPEDSKVLHWTPEAFPVLNPLLMSTWMKCSFIALTPKDLRFATFWDYYEACSHLVAVCIVLTRADPPSKGGTSISEEGRRCRRRVRREWTDSTYWHLSWLAVEYSRFQTVKVGWKMPEAVNWKALRCAVTAVMGCLTVPQPRVSRVREGRQAGRQAYVPPTGFRDNRIYIYIYIYI